MKSIKLIFIFFLFIAFFSGIYVCGYYKSPYIESFDSSGNIHDSSGNEEPLNNCPDLLIRSGNSLLLYNSKIPESEGMNPLPFYNLDEYINYLEIQRKRGIHCPVLYLQEENNAQGKEVYRIRPNPFKQEAGLPSSISLYRDKIKPIPILDAVHDNPPYNDGQYPSFDPYGQHIGTYTDIDAVHDATFIGKSLSENPMDSNWGGVLYTKNAVDSGKYEENEVVPPTTIGPWSEKSDNIHNDIDKNKLGIFA